MNRTRDERRAERERVISRRLAVIRQAWNGHGLQYYSGRSGVLAKFNLACTCGMCKRPRYSRAQAKMQEVMP